MLNPEAVGGSDRVEESPVSAKADSSLNLIRIEIKETAVLKAGGQTRYRDRQKETSSKILKQNKKS